jgi:hypothetical protein
MFYLTLPLSLILLVTAHVAARRHPHQIRSWLFVGVGLTVCAAPLMCSMFAPIVTWILFVTLSLALQAWAVRRERSRYFLPFSATAVVLAYAVSVAIGIRQELQYADFRLKYPIESMADMVPEPATEYRLKTLRANMEDHLDVIDDDIVTKSRFSFRHHTLRRLHESTMGGFINSPGFGVARMIFQPTEKNLQPRRDEGERVQPGHRSGADDWLKTAQVQMWPSGMLKLHDENVLEFVNPLGFGIVESRKKVTGFISHGYAKLPNDNETWGIATVELMGLLLHPEPAVYISNRLPAMDELKGTPTRPPDTFESGALEMLKKGDDLVTAETQDGGRMRMLGSIRNGTTCMKCHGGERGDLLGAFSYILSLK